MDRFILFLLSLLIGFLTHSIFSRISGLISWRHRIIVNGSIILEELPLRKCVKGHGDPARTFIPNVLARWPWPRRIIIPL